MPVAQVSAPVRVKGKSDDDSVSPLQLRTMCDNILHLATTTIACMRLVLWPYLLEFIVPAEFTVALPVVCKSLATIADQLRRDDDEAYDLDYDVLVNIPKPHALIARLMVVAGHPLVRHAVWPRVGRVRNPVTFLPIPV